MTLFFHLLDVAPAEKAESLRNAVRAIDARTFEVEPTALSQVPRSPFAYWVTSRTRTLFRVAPTLASTGAEAKQGLSTVADFRFGKFMKSSPPAAGYLLQRVVCTRPSTATFIYGSIGQMKGVRSMCTMIFHLDSQALRSEILIIISGPA